jgi:transcriptional regulator with XRE-family HTH domain
MGSLKVAVMDNFGGVLREKRRGRELTQRELSKRSRLSAGYLGMLELNHRRPKREIVERICEGLELDALEANELLLAAGFSPRPGSPMEPVPSGPLEELRDAKAATLRGQKSQIRGRLEGFLRSVVEQEPRVRVGEEPRVYVLPSNVSPAKVHLVFRPSAGCFVEVHGVEVTDPVSRSAARAVGATLDYLESKLQNASFAHHLRAYRVPDDTGSIPKGQAVFDLELGEEVTLSGESGGLAFVVVTAERVVTELLASLCGLSAPPWPTVAATGYISPSPEARVERVEDLDLKAEVAQQRLQHGDHFMYPRSNADAGEPSEGVRRALTESGVVLDAVDAIGPVVDEFLKIALVSTIRPRLEELTAEIRGLVEEYRREAKAVNGFRQSFQELVSYEALSRQLTEQITEMESVLRESPRIPSLTMSERRAFSERVNEVIEWVERPEIVAQGIVEEVVSTLIEPTLPLNADQQQTMKHAWRGVLRRLAPHLDRMASDRFGIFAEALEAYNQGDYPVVTGYWVYLGGEDEPEARSVADSFIWAAEYLVKLSDIRRCMETKREETGTRYGLLGPYFEDGVFEKLKGELHAEIRELGKRGRELLEGLRSVAAMLVGQNANQV